ncbi:MAG: 3-methyl-2-oxobutanoate hydroxymethyltransferase [Thermodesulfobacteriota bacterium]
MARKTVVDIRLMKEQGRKISVLTAYDVHVARMLDGSGIDIVLVGDSLGMVVLGYDSTVPVTMAEMLHHCRAVARGVERALLVGDMPFLSYQVSPEEAVNNAGRFFKEGGCDAVKVEGGRAICPAVRRIVDAGMPVMGHLGLTPQSAGQLGGFKVQGKDLASARRMLDDARALEDAGAFAVVLECVPDTLAAVITERLAIPTIGIGAGPGCDGQVLVTHDMIGLFDKFTPKFVKQYANVAPVLKEAVAAFIDEVGRGAFPDEAHSFAGAPRLRELLARDEEL